MRNGHGQGLIVWFTWLSGSGKSTICQSVFSELQAQGIAAEILDADELRQHICRDLGYSRADRDENVMRIGYVAKLLTRNRIVTLVAAISPYREARELVRQNTNFLEVYVDAPLSVCEQRDVKGLYRKVRAGEIQGFTGIDDPYEPPLAPEIVCQTDYESIEQCTDKVITAIVSYRLIASKYLPVNGDTLR